MPFLFSSIEHHERSFVTKKHQFVMKKLQRSIHNPNISTKSTLEKEGNHLPKSYRGILNEVRICKHNTYKYTISYIKFQFKLLHIKCHVLEFTKHEAKRLLQRITQSFAEAIISHGKHILFTLKESVPRRMIYTCESQ
jgi:hypothetical protein